MDSLKSIECDPNCGFKVRSHDEGEVINVAKNHVKNVHKADTTTADLKKMMKTESMAQ